MRRHGAGLCAEQDSASVGASHLYGLFVDKADKQLQRLLWSLDFCKISAGTHHTHNKEQHEQGKSNSLHRTVNIHDDIPYRASLKVLWGLGNELPYLG